jgi:hypothetical protein
MNSRFVLQLFATIATLLGPFAVGTVKLTPGSALIFVIVLASSAYCLRWVTNKYAGQNLVLALAVACLTVTLVDLVARPFLRPIIWVRANAMFEHVWPPLPLLHRYDSHVRYRGRMFGDLASMTGIPADREEREELFITDTDGFRNDLSSSAQAHGVDVILLGDSFGDGANTTQPDTLSAVLSRDYGYRTHNLSMGGAGPWEEYINLSLELDRLPLRSEDTIVLWTIFSGNDLDDPCYLSHLTKEELPWNGRLHSLLVSYATFRERSPVRRLRLSAEFALRSALGRQAALPQVLREIFLDGSTLLFLSDLAERRSRSATTIL